MSFRLPTVVGLVIAIVVAGCSGSPPSRLAVATATAPGVAPSAPRASTPTEAASPSPTTTPAPSDDAFPLFGPLPTQPVDAVTAGRLQAVLDRAATMSPDAIAAVISPAGTWAGAAGIDGPKGRKAEPTDEFAIASVTKTVTATLIFKLVEDGKIDLDAPISRYVKALGVDGNGATVRQVLGMRSGMGDTPRAFYDAVYADCGRTWTPKELVAMFGTPVGPPGTSQYSNPGYKLLGFAAEAVTGMPMAAAFRLVLDPAGGERMMLQTAKSKPPAPFALPLAGHNGDMPLDAFGKGGGLPCLAYGSGSLSASGIASDAPSLARWGWALGSGQIVSHESLATMATEGLGLEPMLEVRRGAYGHLGSQPGYASLFALVPTDQAVVVLFQNDGDRDVTYVGNQLVGALNG